MQRRSTSENDVAYGQSRRRVMSGPGGLITHGQQAIRASSHLLAVAGLGFTVLAALLPRFATSWSLRTLLILGRNRDIVTTATVLGPRLCASDHGFIAARRVWCVQLTRRGPHDVPMPR